MCPFMSTFGENLRSRRESLGVSYAALSRKTGVAADTLRKMEVRKGSPRNRSDVVSIADALDTTPEYLLLGVHSSGPDDKINYMTPAMPPPPEDMVEIPHFTFPRPSAGFGNDYFTGHPDGLKSLPKRLADQATGRVISCIADGNSMEPLIPNGSTLSIDLGKQTLITGRTYVFRVGEEVFVKQWASLGSPGRGKLISANSNYPDIEVDEHTDLECVARVLRASTNNDL